MIKRLLVADRGEIASRVFATCRVVGIETVAVYADADAGSPHVAAADIAVRLPGDAPADTYLRGDLVIAAARRTGVDTVHPGCGPLAEDARFAQDVTDAGLTWIGPPAKVIAAMGSKLDAKQLLAEAGVPTLPAYVDPEQVDEFPVLVKAASGSGGRGIRVVRDAAALPEAVASVRREAAAVFGDDTVFCERYLEHARHIEVQVLADGQGRVVAFGERECSVQRRHQKVIEETPSPAVSPPLRARLWAAASDAARAVGYVGVGTVEFLLEPGEDDGGTDRFHFLEMNTRLQVEHPVTECVCGVDLVHLQIQIAEGAPLPLPGPPPIRGHAIEVRLCAEDPAYAWLPSVGTLDRIDIPDVAAEFRPLRAPGLRLDSGVADGSVIGGHYDPMLAKLIAWAPTRHEAARMLAGALSHARIHGVTTNRDLLVRVLRNPAFLAGEIDTRFLDDHPEVFAPLASSIDGVRLSCLAAALAGAASRRADAPVLRSLPSGWRNVPACWQTTVYEGPAGPVEVGYRFGRDGSLRNWWARPVDPDDLDLAGLGQATLGQGGLFDDQPPVTVLSAGGDLVVMDVNGVRQGFAVHRIGEVSYVDSREGAVALTEVPRFPPPGPELADGPPRTPG